MRYLLIAAAIAAGPALAGDLVLRHGADTIRLTQGACPPSVLRHIPQGNRGHFLRAHAVVDGKQHEACYALANGSFVHLYYSDGDQGFVPAEMFKEDAGV